MIEPHSLIDDRVADGVFRVDRGIYDRPDIFAAELDRIFERTWVYLCHESQLPEHGHYYASHIGRQPVFVIRQRDGGLCGFINACAHRGAILTERRRGRAKTLVCRFHGWCYGTDGRCVRIKDEAGGWPEGADRERRGLTPVARLADYRGFIFGCLSAAAPDLEDSLGPARPFIDLMADQSPDGLEVVPGSQTYMVHGNWKLNAENGVDGYHVSTVHKVFAGAMAKREALGDVGGQRLTEAGRIAGTVPTGCYDLGNGHSLLWADRANPEVAPLYEAASRLGAAFTSAKVDWMVRRGRNLFVFPNLHLMDQSSTQIRVARPVAPDRTEVRVYCIAPKGESRAARSARLRKFEDFFMVTGLATPDDLAALEDSQLGAAGRASRWTNLDRGLATLVSGADQAAAAIGAEPVSSAASFDHETLYYGFFRRWASLMAADGGAA